MYAIYGNIYHQYTPNVSIYTIHGSYGYIYIYISVHVYHISISLSVSIPVPWSACGQQWVQVLGEQLLRHRTPFLSNEGGKAKGQGFPRNIIY